MRREAVVAAFVVTLLFDGSVEHRGEAWAGEQSARAATDEQEVRALLEHLEQLVLTGDLSAYDDLLADTADRAQAASFAELEFQPGVTRAVILERDLQPLPGGGHQNAYRAIVDAFSEQRDVARVATWELDLLKTATEGWRVANQSRLSVVENLYRLSVTPSKQFEAHNFRVTAEDLELTLTQGSVFTIDTDRGVTGLVLLGRGDLRFSPSPETEQEQVKLFAGSPMLESRFDVAYVRVGEPDLHADLTELVARPVDPRELRRAEQVFREDSLKAYRVELREFSQDTWSLLPAAGDFLAEVRTKRFDTLTYARSGSEPEDVSLFNRRRQKNIAVYASAENLASRGRFYNEDDLAAYDILDYEIDLAIDPQRHWIDGRATVRLETRQPVTTQLTIRLADSLAVHSLSSDEFGRLFSLRATNQDRVLVNLPRPLESQTQMTLRITYSGQLQPQSPTRETLTVGQYGFESRRTAADDAVPLPPLDPSYLYSNRTYWYPQAPITDYATATIRISVPANLGCVATGELSTGSPTLLTGKRTSDSRKLYQFVATRPVRYLAFLVGRFTRAEQMTIEFGDRESDSSAHLGTAAPLAALSEGRATLDLTVETHPRQVRQGRGLALRAAHIAQFYRSIVGDLPYESFTLALIDGVVPGGHSPGYFATLLEPPPNTPLVWRNDPASFDGYPEFFLAHELAHQWWGQAIGWANYHEQWLSEGFAQYFAALYARHHRGDEMFAAILRQLRRWSLAESDQGPVYLGYRLGHLHNDGRIFRALIYNKGAAILHMLRRVVGDEAFFRALRSFYVGARFRKAGTHELREAMELEAGRSLERFFERWIHGSALPRINFNYRVDSASSSPHVVLRFDQSGDLFDVPLTAILQYADRRSVSVPVLLTDRTLEMRVTLDGVLRSVDISQDDGALARVGRN